MERILNEAVVVYFEVLYRHLIQQTKRNHENDQSFRSLDPRKRNRNADHSNTIFGKRQNERKGTGIKK
jgi:hypothetical protein